MAVAGYKVDCLQSSAATSRDLPATTTATGAISRRRFLAGTGLTLASTSLLGPWLKNAAAASDLTPLPDGFTTGVSDAFGEIANQGGEFGLRAFDQLVAANAHSVRFPIEWDRVETRQGRFDWSEYDLLYRLIVFHGLKAQPVIVGCPDWLGGGERKSAANGVAYATGSRALNSFGEFAVETLRHFSSFGDHVDAIEVWSEPNNPRGAFIPDPAEFSRMLGTVALFVDCANRDGLFATADAGEITVLAGGLYAEAGERKWERYLAGFQEQPFSYQVALHVPASSTRGIATAKEYAERSAEEIGAVVDRAAAQSGRQVWVTGTGASARPPWGEAGQALALGSIANALADRNRCRAMMVAGLRSKYAQTSAIDNSSPPTGLVHADGSPTPALATLRTAWASR